MVDGHGRPHGFFRALVFLVVFSYFWYFLDFLVLVWFSNHFSWKGLAVECEHPMCIQTGSAQDVIDVA
jgi:hypothetical protein